jgi:hypothetical protein
LSEPSSSKDASGPAENCDASPENELSGTVFGSSVQAGTILGGIQLHIEARSTLPTPAQLPPSRFLTGRERELKELADLRRSTSREGETNHLSIVVITGAAGVGKTALGTSWLNQIRDEYKDGQLFVDLRGFSGGDRPMPSSEPLEGFLRALGISADGIPVNPDEQAALFRSLTTQRRMIIMLDNAVSAAQVRSLLPGPGPALVVVTTRRSSAGLILDGARLLSVEPLDKFGARDLLQHMLGADRIRAEPDEALSLVALCGGLPLAVCAAGARLASRRRWSIARVVKELIDETRRLSLLSMEDDFSITGSLDLSYRALPDKAARLYRILGMHTRTDFGTETAAALAGITLGEAALQLAILDGANLLEEVSTDRFRFHVLFRLHAREKFKETRILGSLNTHREI